jgi:hypothetical protein
MDQAPGVVRLFRDDDCMFRKRRSRFAGMTAWM